MLEPAHLRLHEFAERDLDIDTVDAFGNRYAGDCWTRIARRKTSGILGGSPGRSQDSRKKNQRHCCIDTHGWRWIPDLSLRAAGAIRVRDLSYDSL